jgi:hypothetical protein
LPVFLDARVGAGAQRRRWRDVRGCAADRQDGGACGEPFLDWLDVSRNFSWRRELSCCRTLQLVAGTHPVRRGERKHRAAGSTAAAGPSIAAAMSTRRGSGSQAIGASALVLWAAPLLLVGEWIESRAGRAAIGLFGRLNGASGVIAIELAVDGVQASGPITSHGQVIS